MLTPARRRGVEILDDPAQDPKLAVRSLRDVALANRLFGGHSAPAVAVIMRRDALGRFTAAVDHFVQARSVPSLAAATDLDSGASISMHPRMLVLGPQGMGE